jgi:hypothetical protein
METREPKRLFYIMKTQRDLAFLLLSIVVAIVVAESGVMELLRGVPERWTLFAAFVSGIGFASAFFAAPATVAIFHFAKTVPFWHVAVVAAWGAMVGDSMIFRFLKDGLVDDFRFFLEEEGTKRRLAALFRSKIFHWISAFVAALIIASPLPDEIGLALFGVLRFDLKRFLPISFALNFLGIFIIALFGRLALP